MDHDRPVGLQVLFVRSSGNNSRRAVAKAAARFALDLRAMEAAVASSIAAPDQAVQIELIGAPKVS
jgi:hypothetical protein